MSTVLARKNRLELLGHFRLQDIARMNDLAAETSALYKRIDVLLEEINKKMVDFQRTYEDTQITQEDLQEAFKDVVADLLAE